VSDFRLVVRILFAVLFVVKKLHRRALSIPGRIRAKD